MQKGFMYIDETIQLDFEMPKELQDCIKELDTAFEKNDEAMWDTNFESVGVLAKGFYSMGEISSEQMHKIWERYGTAG